MATWLNRIDLKEEWRQAQNEEISAAELGRLIAAKLESLPTEFHYLELKNIIVDIGYIPEVASFDDIDDILERLYDWADSSPMQGVRNCWIATF